MEVRIVEQGKKDFLDLLLLADEQEDQIDKYLDRGTLFALYDGGLRSICVVTDEGNGVFELQNLATYEAFQGKGYGSDLVRHVLHHYRGKGSAMLAGTGDVPWILRFYGRCGFALSHRLERYFTVHYAHAMFDGDIQLVDKVYLKQKLGAE